MKTEWRIFGIVAAFLFVACGRLRVVDPRRAGGHVEWIGIVALVLSGLLCLDVRRLLLVRLPAHRPAPGGPAGRRRSPTAPARSASSARAATGRSAWRWPPLIAGIGLVFWQWWLIAVGLVAVTVVGACGLLFEYYTGARRGAH